MAGIIALGAMLVAAVPPALAVDGAVFAPVVPGLHTIDFTLTRPAPPPVADAQAFRLPPERADPVQRRAGDLVAVDREAGRTGTIVRRPRLAAGLLLRLVADDGLLLPEVGMSGPAGRALVRLADEAAAD